MTETDSSARRIVTGRFSLQLAPLKSGSDTLYHALETQLNLHNNYTWNAMQIKGKLQQILLREDRYESSANSQQNAHNLGHLVRFLKFGVEIYKPDGTRLILPYLFSLTEPLLQLYYQGNTYYSVLEVRELNVLTEPLEPTGLTLRIGTWNTQGGTTASRQACIDHACQYANLDIVCLQDVRVQSTHLETDNFIWFTSFEGKLKTRVNGFLINKRLKCQVQTTILSPSMQIIYIQMCENEIILMNVYMPCEGEPETLSAYEDLYRAIQQLRRSYLNVMLLCLGDYNAHLGGDRDESELHPNLIGPHIYHSETNENGGFLWTLMTKLQLASCTTIHDSSTLVTRYQSSHSSQLDHVLVPVHQTHLITSYYGSWNRISDHKMIHFRVQIPWVQPCNPDITVRPPRNHLNVRPKYCLNLLRIPKQAKNFTDKLREKNQATGLKTLFFKDIHQAWDLFIQNVHEIGLEKLRTKPEQNDEIRQAHMNYRDSMLQLHTTRIIDRDSIYTHGSDFPRHDPDLVCQVAIRRRQLAQNIRRLRHSETLAILKNIEKTAHVSVRLQQTFKLIRHLRQNAVSTTTKPLSSKILCEELATLDRGPIEVVPLNDHFPITRFPTFTEIRESYYETLRTGTAPGDDQLYNEFLKYIPEVQSIVYKFIEHSYYAEQFPEQWHQTNITLLPKKTGPKTFDDYRPITLCSVAYKCYAQILLEQLKVYLPSIPEYQSGFLNNRSTDDSLFILHRVLEKNWNHRTPVYLLSLDIKKAFSRVNIHKLPEILLNRGAPAFLVNRIVSVCLHEQTRIRCQGVVTPFYRKTLGVKQGCPISPYIFVTLLDDALQKISVELTRLPEPIKLFLGEPQETLELPLLLGYADDMTLLSTSLPELNQIMRVFSTVLATYGLEFNALKCVLVPKAPDGNLPHDFGETHGETVTLGGLTIPVRDKVTILGSRINSNMNRRNMVIDRLTKATRLFYQLVQLLRPQRLPFKLLIRVYSAIILPIVIYGLRSVSITKSNKELLMRREIQMIRKLAEISQPVPTNDTILNLLRRRTVNRALVAGRIGYYAHLTRTNPLSYLRRAFTYRLRTTRKVGRPLYTYRETLGKEFENFPPTTVAEWKKAFKTSTETKKICQRLYETDLHLGDPLDPDLLLYTTL